MTTYNTYQEAKIANPESEIYIDELGLFRCGRDTTLATKKCNPADHCMTVEKFLADGHRFVSGDMVFDDGEVETINSRHDIEAYNEKERLDRERFILRAAALEEKPKRMKVEYVKCEYGDKVSNIVIDFENNAPLYKMVNDEYWTIDELDDLFAIILDGGEHIYRRIETEIDERQEFIDALSTYCKDNGYGVNRRFLGDIFDSKLVQLVESE